jgi:thioredoxin reductase
MEAVIPRPGDRVPKPIRYDLIIIGGGPAGLTAAVYASLLGMQALLISPNLGGQTVKGSKSKNNVGYEFISGGELIFRFQDQLLQHDYLKHRIAEVKTVQHCGDHLKVQAKRGGEQYEATALIITTGMRRRFFGVPGEQRVAGVQVKNQESGEEQYFPVGGSFIELGWMPNTETVSSLVDLNSRGEIQIRPDCSTSCEGVFAAGDVTNAFGKLVIIAIGEGAKAALSAHEYLLNVRPRKAKK